MNDELVDVLDDSGATTGVAKLKRDVHRDGDWHRSVHAWITGSDGRLLLQKRAPTKETHANLWDISAAGHVSAGESSLESAVREIEEELGIRVPPSDLELVATTTEQWILNDGRYLDNEFHDIYLVRRDVDPDSLTLQRSEVAEARLVALDEFRAMCARRDPSLVPHWDEYASLLEILGR